MHPTNDTVSATHHYLLARYGPLLTLKHLAEVLHSTPNGLRMAMSRKREPFASALGGAVRRFGRRTYFDARRVAELIDRDDSPLRWEGVGGGHRGSSWPASRSRRLGGAEAKG